MAVVYVAPDALGVPGPGVPTGSPTGTGSASAPYDMQTGWAGRVAGDTILQMPGIYRGDASMVDVPDGTYRVRMLTLEPGTSTRIDGEQLRTPVRIDGGDKGWLELDGFTAHDSISNEVALSDVHDIRMVNFVCWKDSWPTKPYGNHHMFNIAHTSRRVLLDNFGLFGQTDRKMLSVSGQQEDSGLGNLEVPCTGITIRNGWVRWDGNYLGANTGTGNRGGIYPMYRAHVVDVEDCIVTTGGGTGVLPPKGTDPNADLSPSFYGSDTTSQIIDRIHFRRCAALGEAGVRIDYGGGIRVTSGTGPDPPGELGDKDYSDIQIEQFVAAFRSDTYDRHYNLQTNSYPEQETGNGMWNMRICSSAITKTDTITPDWWLRTPVTVCDSEDPIPLCELPMRGRRHPLADRIIASTALTAWDAPTEFQLGGDWGGLYM